MSQNRIRPSAEHRMLLTIIWIVQFVWAEHQCKPSNDCSITEMIPCIVREEAFCTANISEFARPAGDLTWAGKARDFTVKAQEVPCHGDTVSGLYFTWKPPLEGSLQHLKGFQLSVIAQDGKFRGKSQCRILDLRNASWTVHDVDETFHYTLYPVPDSTTFSVRFVSLPTPEVVHQAEMSYLLTIYTPPRGPSAWTTRIYWSLQGGNNMMVTFHPAPKDYNFREYDVILMEVESFDWYRATIKVDNQKDFAQPTPEKLQTVFHNVSEGEYELRVTPIGGECQNDCKTSRNSSVIVMAVTHRTDRESPTTIETLSTPKDPHQAGMNYIMPPLEVSDTSTSGSSHDVTKTALGFGLGGTVVVAVILFMAVYFIKRKQGFHSCTWKSTPNPSGNVDNLTTGNTEHRHTGSRNTENSRQLLPLERKTVFLVYSTDNQHYCSLVSAFARYLQTFCFLDVLHIDWSFSDLQSNGLRSWVSKSLNRADVIIVMHSVGAAKQFRALMEGKQFKSVQSSLKGCLFVNAISVLLAAPSLRKRCIDVTFQHGSPSTVFSYEGQTRVYVLMGEFREFLLRVHKLKDDRKTFDLPLNATHSETEEGRELVKSIKNTIQHDQQNPCWPEVMFCEAEADVTGETDHHFNDVMISHSSSGYCSQDQNQFVEPDELVECEEDGDSISEQLRNINAACSD